MEECMRECMRKLAIWHTKTFRPIMTHEELEPIMATLGFLARPEMPSVNGVVSKEYVFAAGGCRCGAPPYAAEQSMPRPRLPTHRIDGLHISTYRAFIDAVNFYLEMDDISDLFHVRGMPLHRFFDQNKKFRRMDEDESVFVYREGTRDQASYNFYRSGQSNVDGGSPNFELRLHTKRSNMSVGTIVPLKYIIV